MIKEFNTYLESIDSDFWSRLCRELGTLRRFEKGDEFISIGKVAKHIGLIKTGSVKYVAYNSELDEKIVGLETVGGFAASWPFCLHNLPSHVSIVANSDVEIYCLPVAMLIEMTSDNLDLERRIASSTEFVFYTAYQRLIDLYTKSAKERYEKLVADCPQIFDIFSLKDIASFLNITPVHLSRLRKA